MQMMVVCKLKQLLKSCMRTDLKINESKHFFKLLLTNLIQFDYGNSRLKRKPRRKYWDSRTCNVSTEKVKSLLSTLGINKPTVHLHRRVKLKMLWGVCKSSYLHFQSDHWNSLYPKVLENGANQPGDFKFKVWMNRYKTCRSNIDKE